MDTTRAIYKRPIHEHPLLPSTMVVSAKCGGCHVKGIMYTYYHCNDSYCFFHIHKECAEAPLEINHPYHPEHPLLLTDESEDSPCDFCGQKLLSPYYSCPTCEFKLDFICGIKPPPPAIEHPMCHDHPLVFLKKQGEKEEVPCEVCKETIGGRPPYSCLECEVYFHVDCVHLSKEVNHPCHSNHPLKITAAESLTDDDADKTCNVCHDQPKKVLYHCSFCNFTMCLGCTRDPPPLIIQHTKTHRHPLTYVSSKIKFTCKVCGMPEAEFVGFYICLKCGFLVHGLCIGLPQVININRHDHRISFTHHLGHGRIKCGVCRESVSQYYGAYSCSVCSNYAVHSRCAARSGAWDGVELEGIPEIIEYIAPFKVVGDNLITHFSHEEHTLRFNKDNFIYDECTRCEACVHPVGFDPIYSCVKCCFFLHEKCANLPRKKKIVLEPTAYTLKGASGLVDCVMCKEYSNGFKYIPLRGMNVDVHCGSLSEPFVHGCHLHPLFFGFVQDYQCDVCKRGVTGLVLGCNACRFVLCAYCASLPQKLRYNSDEHPLILYCGEKVSGENWCNNCEKVMDPSGWFFTCSDCEVTFHIRCVLGDFSRLMPASIIEIEKKDFKVVLNNRNTRPLCSQCHSRCKVSIILKDCGEEEDNGYICSRLCLSKKLST